MNTDKLVIETQHVSRELNTDPERPVSYLMSDPQRERIADTIFAGVHWSHLRGRIFEFCRHEYGRYVSKVYIDRKNSDAVQTGWVFERKERFEDSPDQYVHEVWVTLLQPVKCDRGQEHLEPFTFTRPKEEVLSCSAA